LTSVEYYDQNASAFFADTVDADMRAPRARFLRHVQPGGRILDAGCGSGRDALAFANAGFEVTAIDASAEMAMLASRHTGLDVRQMTFAEIPWKGAFDGIWASASLLHVTLAELPSTISRLAAALRTGGALFASFKEGLTERQHRGRHFTDLTLEGLATLLRQSGGLVLVDEWTSRDVRPGRAEERWVSAIGRLEG
jgi:2-polyprenyl-3-methyl-5-hydroxy-6-metoxy-1,4-benzoquinol methylase